eukprot:scaffold686_cov234-Pinguiococcus_pyrenoidosus.AAC.4
MKLRLSWDPRDLLRVGYTATALRPLAVPTAASRAAQRREGSRRASAREAETRSRDDMVSCKVETASRRQDRCVREVDKVLRRRLLDVRPLAPQGSLLGFCARSTRRCRHRREARVGFRACSGLPLCRAISPHTTRAAADMLAEHATAVDIFFLFLFSATDTFDLGKPGPTPSAVALCCSYAAASSFHKGALDHMHRRDRRGFLHLRQHGLRPDDDDVVPPRALPEAHPVRLELEVEVGKALPHVLDRLSAVVPKRVGPTRRSKTVPLAVALRLVRLADQDDLLQLLLGHDLGGSAGPDEVSAEVVGPPDLAPWPP